MRTGGSILSFRKRQIEISSGQRRGPPGPRSLSLPSDRDGRIGKRRCGEDLRDDDGDVCQCSSSSSSTWKYAPAGDLVTSDSPCQPRPCLGLNAIAQCLIGNG